MIGNIFWNIIKGIGLITLFITLLVLAWILKEWAINKLLDKKENETKMQSKNTERQTM